MKNQFSIVSLSAILIAQAATASTIYLVDFNTVTSGTYPSSNWNTYGYDAGNNVVIGGTLTDSTGASSSVGIGYSGTLTKSDNYGTAVYDTSEAPAWVANGSDDVAAAADYFYTDTNDDTASFTINLSGLTAGSEVSLDVWTSRANTNSGVGFYEYSLDGSNWFGLTVLNSDGTASSERDWDENTTITQSFKSDVDANDQGLYMSTQVVTLTGSTLQFRGTDSGTNWASVGAMQLTVVPESGTYALLAGICSLTFVMLRRRNQA
jgi:hypothetical protein